MEREIMKEIRTDIKKYWKGQKREENHIARSRVEVVRERVSDGIKRQTILINGIKGAVETYIVQLFPYELGGKILHILNPDYHINENGRMLRVAD